MKRYIQLFLLFSAIVLQIVGISTDTWTYVSTSVTVPNSTVTRQSTHIGLWKSCSDYFHPDNTIGISNCLKTNFVSSDSQQRLDVTRSFAIIGVSTMTVIPILYWTRHIPNPAFKIIMIFALLSVIIALGVFSATFKQYSGLVWSFGYSWVLYLIGAILSMISIGVLVYTDFFSKRHLE